MDDPLNILIVKMSAIGDVIHTLPALNAMRRHWPRTRITWLVEEAAADIRRALAQGMPGGGYVFGTSNCIYTGMSLARYDLMLDIWRAEGQYE